MQVKWNKKPSSIAKEMSKDVKETTSKLLEAFGKEIEVNARRNFNKAIDEISGDDPYVVVVRSSGVNDQTISCMGSQVLFAEFGAGAENRYNEKDIFVGEHTSISSSGTPFIVHSYTRTIVYSAKGFANGGMSEIAPRPSGIVPLGTYGKGLGVNTFWVRPTQNGRKSTRESNVHTPSGIKQGVVWTEGTRPVRALWRARNTAISKLQSGRLDVK